MVFEQTEHIPSYHCSGKQTLPTCRSKERFHPLFLTPHTQKMMTPAISSHPFVLKPEFHNKSCRQEIDVCDVESSCDVVISRPRTCGGCLSHAERSFCLCFQTIHTPGPFNVKSSRRCNLQPAETVRRFMVGKQMVECNHRLGKYSVHKCSFEGART